MLLVIGNKNYSSWSLRPWLAFKAFQIPFEEKVIFLDQPNTTEEILKFSPSQKVPCLVAEGQSIWDSLAIMEYLNESYPQKQMWPKDAKARAHARSVSNEMHSGFSTLRELCPMKVKERFPGFNHSKASSDIQRIQEIWSECLKKSGGPYLFGEFSIADCMYAPVVFRFQSYDVQLNSMARSYVQTMLAHPGMVEWQKDASAEQMPMQRYEQK